MVEIASAALQELLYLPPDGVWATASSLFSDDCVVVGADFPALPLKKASKTKPWGEAYAREGVVLENYRAASVHVDDDERVFRVSLGFVLRSAPNPLEALAESLAPLGAVEAADLKEELDRSLEPVISAAGATLLELEANRAALDASVAEANAQYAAAKADLETTLAEYEAKYEELTFSLPSFKAPETKKAPPPPKAPSPPKAKQSFSFFGPTPAPAPKPTPAPAPKPASKGSGFSFFGGGEDAPPPSPKPAAKPAAPASKGFSLYTPPPSPSPAAKPAPASKGFSFFGATPAEARARQQAKDDAAKAARKRNAPNRNG
ncbi:hypothetical protein JL722_150 [Aureococcus anophagefferens]|nr:hypothetical protein JL722_150 [Aureococcus anophagefferens]